MSQAVDRIEAARARGVDVMASVYPYIASSTGLDQVLPDWVTEGGTDATLARLADPALRDSLEAELSGRTQSGDWTLGTSAGGPSGIQISDIVTDSLEREGSAPGDRRGARPVGGGRRDRSSIADSLRTAAIYFSMSEDDLVLALRQPWVMIGGRRRCPRARSPLPPISRTRARSARSARSLPLLS